MSNNFAKKIKTATFGFSRFYPLCHHSKLSCHFVVCIRCGVDAKTAVVCETYELKTMEYEKLKILHLRLYKWLPERPSNPIVIYKATTTKNERIKIYITTNTQQQQQRQSEENLHTNIYRKMEDAKVKKLKRRHHWICTNLQVSILYICNYVCIEVLRVE